MALIEINWSPSHREVRQFAAILLVVAALVGGLAVYRSDAWRTAFVVWTLGALAGGIGLAAPRLLKPVMVGWMVAAYPIGWTVSSLVLLLTYYLIFFPVALIMRLFRYDPLDRRIEPDAPSYWDEQSQAADQSAYFRQF